MAPVAVTVNFILYGILVFVWTGFHWKPNLIFAVYVECSNFLASVLFMAMPLVLLLLVIILPLSLPAGKKAGIVLASLGLDFVMFVMALLLMATPDYGL